MALSTLFRLTLQSPERTAELAARLAALLAPGDTVLLEGPLGAGKTHLARSLIRALQGPGSHEDIPSPTFTLVQTYDSPVGEIWHADLYRLTDPDEIFELGLEGAMETAICLVEWPDRMGDDTPRSALWLTLSHGGEHRRDLVVRGDANWAARLTGLANAESSA